MLTLFRARHRPALPEIDKGNDMLIRRFCDGDLRAWHSLPGSRFKSAFSTWAHAIARKLTTSYFRYGKVRAENAIPLDFLRKTMTPLENASWEGLAPGPDPYLIGVQLAASIDQSIANLSPNMRSGFVPRECDVVRYQKIAKQLFMPISTIRLLIFGARATIGSDLRPM